MFRCFFGQKEKVNPKPNIPEPVRNEPVVPSPQDELERQIVAGFRPLLSTKEIEKNNAVLSGIAKEAERKKQEFIDAESQKVRDLMLDYIQYPHKYTGNELHVIYAGGFDIDFEPLINAVNKCKWVRIRKINDEWFEDLQNDVISRRKGRCYYRLRRIILPSQIDYEIY